MPLLDELTRPLSHELTESYSRLAACSLLALMSVLT